MQANYSAGHLVAIVGVTILVPTRPCHITVTLAEIGCLYIKSTGTQSLNHWPLGNLNIIFRHAIIKRIFVIDGWGIFCEIDLIWMSQDFTDDQSTLVQVMAWCRQATSHYLSQCWPRSLSPYGVTRPQWVKWAAVTWYKDRAPKTLLPVMVTRATCSTDILQGFLIDLGSGNSLLPTWHQAIIWTNTINTLSPWQNGCHYFQMHFLEIKCFYLDQNFIAIYYPWIQLTTLVTQRFR